MALVSLLPSGVIQAGAYVANQARSSASPRSNAQTSAGSGAGKIEMVPAILVPFDMSGLGGPLSPIRDTGGLVFQYTPGITETIQVEYTDSEIIHTNEQFNVYKQTENRKISLTGVTFTADTEENARYMLAAIHFFRVYSMMDFGKGKSGRPPSPMWFSAYGQLAFQRVPVLLSGATINWPKENDYVRVSASTARQGTSKNPSSTVPLTARNEARTPGRADPPPFDSDLVGLPDKFKRGYDIPSVQQQVQGLPGTSLANSLSGLIQPSSGAGSTSGDYAWVPTKMEIEGITLTVQHSTAYWKNTFSLEDFYAGGMVESRETSSPSSTGGSGSAPSMSDTPFTSSGAGPSEAAPAALPAGAVPAGVPATRADPKRDLGGLTRDETRAANNRNGVTAVDPFERLRQLRRASGSGF